MCDCETVHEKVNLGSETVHEKVKLGCETMHEKVKLAGWVGGGGGCGKTRGGW